MRYLKYRLVNRFFRCLKMAKNRRKKTRKKNICFVVSFYFQKTKTLSPILIKASSSSKNFAWDIVFWKFFRHVFLLRYLDKRWELCCISNWPKQGIFMLFFAFCVSSTTDKRKKISNMQTTIIDIKLDEEFKSELRIGLPLKTKPENCKNLSKNEGKWGSTPGINC